MLHERFAALLQSLGPFSSSPHFAIALSGGADSLALTLLMRDYVAQHGGRITTLTVDHCLRAESTDEAHHVAAMMRTHGIPHHVLTPEHDASSKNLQEAARHWRYRALGNYCQRNGILHCLVAHNAGDNRETVAHNMKRGTTEDGASGMRYSHNLYGVRFLRPLLSMERSELENFLRSHRTQWIEDPSNQNPLFARVRARQRLQHDAFERTTLDTTINQQRLARTTRDHALAHVAMRCATIYPLGFAEINLMHWRTLESTLASQLLADCITTISGSTSRPRGSDTQRLVEALQQPFTTRTLHRCSVSLKNNKIRIAREFAHVAAPFTLTGTGEIRWDGRFTFWYDLPVDTHYNVAALGTKGRKFAITRWGAKADVPASTPALWHLDELVYLPHIEVPHRAAQQVHIGFSPPKPLAAAPFW